MNFLISKLCENEENSEIHSKVFQILRSHSVSAKFIGLLSKSLLTRKFQEIWRLFLHGRIYKQLKIGKVSNSFVLLQRFQVEVLLSIISRLEKLADLASKPNGIEVAVKFINRTSRPAYLETINSEGDRELQYTLNPGGSRTVITEEKTYWIATMNRDTDEGLLLNYGWYYSPVRTRMKKERCYITDCKYYSCQQVCYLY